MMGWSIGFDDKWNRDIGYGVPAYCDHPGCGETIDRGLSFVCGGQPFGGEHGCGLYFCSGHQRYAGAKRDNVQLCIRCRHGRAPYAPTPEHPAWITHMLTDQSWQKWRDDNVELAAAMRRSLIGTAGHE